MIVLMAIFLFYNYLLSMNLLIELLNEAVKSSILFGTKVEVGEK